MDRAEHVYVVDTETLMVELGRVLSERGYQFSRTRQPGRWHVRTQVSRDTAYGDIGASFNSLLALRMSESEPVSG